MRSPYEILGITSNATDDEVKQARRKLLFDLHSDRLPKDLPGGAARLINERVIEINSAYEQIQKERTNSKGNKPQNKSDKGQNHNRNDANKSGITNRTQVNSQKQKSRGTENLERKEEKKEGGVGKAIGQVFSALVVISVLQMCAVVSRINNSTETYATKLSRIVNSSDDYCPELVSSIEQGKDAGSDMHLKMLSEMKRSAPFGSEYRNKVDTLVAALQADNGNPNESTKEQMNELFSKYLVLVCGGELHIAKQRIKGIEPSTDLSTNSQQAQELVANAMCNAMRDGASMETVDSRRSAGAIYMGKEMDKVPESDREAIRIEVAQNTENKPWMDQALLAFVKKCPEVAHRMVEN